MNLYLTDQKQKTKLPGVLRAALKLFIQKGIDGTTIKDIARAAQVAEGSLYRHYKSKEDLAWDLFNSHLDRFTKELIEKVLPEPTAEARIRRFVAESFNAYESDPDLYTYLILQEHNELAKYPSAAEHPGTICIRLIEEGQAKGEIRAGDPVLLASLFIGAIIRVGVVKMYGRLQADLRTQAKDVADSLWLMLKINSVQGAAQ